MPGVVTTDIYLNSRRALGPPAWEQLSDAQLLELLPGNTRATLIAIGMLAENVSADDLRQVIHRMKPELQDKGFTAASRKASSTLATATAYVLARPAQSGYGSLDVPPGRQLAALAACLMSWATTAGRDT